MPGARRRDDQAALPLADRHHQIHHARRQVVGRGFEPETLLRVERRQVLEEHLLARAIGRLEVDRFHLDQGKVPLPVLRLANLPADRVARVQVELPDLRGGHVDVVGSRQVVVVRRAQEAEAVGQRLEHPFRKEVAALLGAGPQDLEDQLLLAHPGGAGHVQRLGYLGELGDVHFFERRELDGYDGRVGVRWRGGRRRRYGCLLRFAISLHRSSSPSPPACRDRQGSHSEFPFQFSEVFRALSARQLVDFRCDQDARESGRVQPVGGLDVRREPRVPRVDQVQDTGHAIPRGRRAFPARCIGVFEIGSGDARQLGDRVTATAGVSISWQVGQIQAPATRATRASVDGDSIQIGQTGLAGRRARPRERAAHERIDHRRLANVGTPDQRDVRDPVGRDPSSVHSAGNELGLKHLQDEIRLSTRSRRREPVERRVPECGIRQPCELAKALRNLYGSRVPNPAYRRDQCDTVVESPAICAAGATATVPSGSASAIFKTSSIDSTM